MVQVSFTSHLHFGEDDSRIGRNYELPFVQFVDGQGNLTKETPYAGVL